MSTDKMNDALAFLDKALEHEYLYAKEWLEYRKAAFEQDPPRWDLRENLLRNRPLIMKYLTIPCLPNASLRPAFDGRSPLYDSAKLLEQEKRFQKRRLFKASLYESDAYDSVVICLLSNNHNSVLNIISERYDIVLDDGKYKIANSSQHVCSECEGARAVKEMDCSCEFNGYIFPPARELGVTGKPIAIRRFERRPDGYRDLYDAEC